MDFHDTHVNLGDIGYFFSFLCLDHIDNTSQGDDPPRDRTAELRVLGFPARHLGPVQMTTDTALGVTKRVIQDKRGQAMSPALCSISHLLFSPINGHPLRCAHIRPLNDADAHFFTNKGFSHHTVQRPRKRRDAFP